MITTPTDSVLQIINFLSNSIKFTKFEKERRITLKLAASVTKPTEKDFGIAFLSPRKDLSKDISMPTTPTVNVPELGLGDEVYIYVGVEDTGRGLTEDECKVLFQRFAQGELLCKSTASAKLTYDLPKTASPKTYKTYGGSYQTHNKTKVSAKADTLFRKWIRSVHQSRSFRTTRRTNRCKKYSRSRLDFCLLHQDSTGRTTSTCFSCWISGFCGSID
jgi:hypothetical protein